MTSAAEEFKAPPDFVDITGDGGVYKKVLTEGSGEEGPGQQDMVFVHYTGTLYGGARDGEKFDSSRDRGDPFSFKLGTGAVIKGWDAAVKTMRAGEVCDVVLRSDYAYGKAGSGANIPPNAPLKFNIQLLRWEGEDLTEEKDGGVVKHCLAKGEGYARPGVGAMVTVNVRGTRLGHEFESRSGVTFEVGLADEAGLPSAVDLAVKSMVKGEKATIKARPPYAESEGTAYELELAEFEKAKESWELSEEEKVAQADLLKAKGTEYFKKSRLRPALTYYNRVVDFLKWDSGFEDKPEELRNRRTALLLAARLNLCLVHYKLGDQAKCIEEADEALKLDPSNAKALFRRGQARMATHDYEEALVDFQKVTEVEPGNKAAEQQIALARKGIAEEKSRQKKTFYGMFDKFAKRDQEQKPPVPEVTSAAAQPAVAENGAEPSAEAAAPSSGDAGVAMET